MTADYGEALRRAILEAPDDDLPRLAYADWLEENGRDAYARNIRQGVREPEATRKFAGGDTLGSAGGGYWLVPESWALAMRRGMVESISLPSAHFLASAKALFDRQPIIHVTLTDGQPEWTWDRASCFFGRGMLFSELFGRLCGDLHEGDPRYAHAKHYPSPPAALAALSAACVAHGRTLAGLPPLPGAGTSV
jgi:uncharacterized protein (TIGR02996 family)